MLVITLIAHRSFYFFYRTRFFSFLQSRARREGAGRDGRQHGSVHGNE